MNHDDFTMLLQFAVIGSIAFAGYEMLRYSESQRRLINECKQTQSFYYGLDGSLREQLYPLMIEQISPFQT